MPIMSLVVSTLGRSVELRRLLDSLERSDFKDFEVIIVDQNDDDRVSSAYGDRQWPFEIRHLRRPGMRGTSRGRNFGWRRSNAPYVMFPDDDCWFPPWLLGRALAVLRAQNAAIVAGRASDEHGRPINARFEATAQPITRRNVFTTQIEWAVLFRREVLEDIGGYDEGMGVGAATPWQAYEGPDIVLRAIARGYKAFFDPDLYGHHEDHASRPVDAVQRRKDRTYARGMGRVLRKHGYGLGSAAFWIGRAALGAATSVIFPARAWLYLGRAIGRAEGYFLEEVHPLTPRPLRGRDRGGSGSARSARRGDAGDGTVDLMSRS